MNSGIYKITNIENGLIYIGKTSYGFKQRWWDHKKRLRKNEKENPYLQNAWNKYGEKNFKFEIIEECSIENLNEREEYWMNHYQSWDREKGYNLIKISSGLNIYPEEVKQKIRNKRALQVFSEETRQKMSESRKGKKLSEEHKQKISGSNKGKHKENKLKGDLNPKAKLTWEQVKEIRAKYIPFIYSSIRLSEEYGVAKGTILNIVHNKGWFDSEIPEFHKAKKPWETKITEEEIIEIRKKYIPRIYTAKMLSEEYGVSWRLIQSIVANKICKFPKSSDE